MSSMYNRLKIKEELKKALEKDLEYQPPHPPNYDELINNIGESNWRKLFILYGYLDSWYDSVAGYAYSLLENNEMKWNNKNLLKQKRETIKEIKNIKVSLRKYPVVAKYFISLLTWWKRILVILNLLLEYGKSADKEREVSK